MCYERVCYERVCYDRQRVCHDRERVDKGVGVVEGVSWPFDVQGRGCVMRGCVMIGCVMIGRRCARE